MKRGRALAVIVFRRFIALLCFLVTKIYLVDKQGIVPFYLKRVRKLGVKWCVVNLRLVAHAVGLFNHE